MAGFTLPAKAVRTTKKGRAKARPLALLKRCLELRANIPFRDQRVQCAVRFHRSNRRIKLLTHLGIAFAQTHANATADQFFLF